VRAVITRVDWARVIVDEEVVGAIERGICAFIGVGQADTEREATWLAEKIVSARIFRDDNDKMNLSLRDVGGKLLAISQFTLYGDLRRGNRPSFGAALEPERALVLFEQFCRHARGLGIEVQTGRFRADMQVESRNQGPVTLLLDSDKAF
jgi:D-tyrosyl-tRNA(Tyr) deacylase